MNKEITKPAKPFLRWAGGKTRLINQLGELLYPKDFNPNTGTYFEPFLGGGAMFFSFIPKNAVLSDLNSCLVNAYNQIKLNVEDVIRSVKNHEENMRLTDHKEYYYQVRSQGQELSEIEQASRFLFLNATCFNGIYRVNKKGKFNNSFGYTGQRSNRLIYNKDNLKAVSEALQGAQIKNQDYKDALKAAKEGDFIYLDPPYHPDSRSGSVVYYTSASFFEKEQIELRDVFIDLMSKGCFVELSNSDTAFINDIYSGIKGLNVRKINIGRLIAGKASKRGAAQELVISNF